MTQDSGDLDFAVLDAKADEWMAECGVKEMANTITGVFAKWASPELLDRFRKQVVAIMRQSFAEGALRAWSDVRPIGPPAQTIKARRAETQSGSVHESVTRRGAPDEIAAMLGLCGEEEVRDLPGFATPEKLRALIDGLITQRARAEIAEQRCADLTAALFVNDRAHLASLKKSMGQVRALFAEHAVSADLNWPEWLAAARTLLGTKRL